MRQILPQLLAGAGVVVLFALLRAAARRPAKVDPATGELVLRSSGLLTWTMVGVALAPSLLLGVVAVAVPSTEAVRQRAAPFIFGIGGLFLLAGGSCALWAARRATRVGPAGLTSEYVFAGPRVLPWAEVTRVTYRGGLECWVHGSGGRKALLHLWYVGVQAAVPLLWEHLPGPVQDECRAALGRFVNAAGGPTGGAARQPGSVVPHPTEPAEGPKVQSGQAGSSAAAKFLAQREIMERAKRGEV